MDADKSLRLQAAPINQLQTIGTGVTAPPPLSLYVHLPWCIRKCPYCDFNSHQQPDDALPEQRYIDALLTDLEAALPSIWGRNIHAVFLGGGTPSLFAPESIEHLLNGIRARVRLNADAEISMEANPGTFEAQRFTGFREAGITRLSIGVQSFDNDALKALGRVHDADQAQAAVEHAARVFETYNLDLMYGLPGQDMAGLQGELDHVRRIAPPHWSCYHLTIEPNTYFARYTPANLPDDDLAADMLDAVVDAAAQTGLQRYEVSAYARAGHRCKHNVNYWRFGDYLGIGAGAHGKLSFHDRIVRDQRLRHPQRYMQAALAGNAVEQTRVLTPQDLSFEFMLNALRLIDGVASEDFAAHTGLSLARVSRELGRAVDDGLLTDDPARIQASPRGMQFLNELQMRFLEEG